MSMHVWCVYCRLSFTNCQKPAFLWVLLSWEFAVFLCWRLYSKICFTDIYFCESACICQIKWLVKITVFWKRLLTTLCCFLSCNPDILSTLIWQNIHSLQGTSAIYIISFEKRRRNKYQWWVCCTRRRRWQNGICQCTALPSLFNKPITGFLQAFLQILLKTKLGSARYHTHFAWLLDYFDDEYIGQHVFWCFNT